MQQAADTNNNTGTHRFIRRPSAAAGGLPISPNLNLYGEAYQDSQKYSTTEIDDRVERLAKERARQEESFKEHWRRQQQEQYGTSQIGERFRKEGEWASTPEEAELVAGLAYPIEAKPWEGEEPFLNNLIKIENYLEDSKIYHRTPCVCKVCGDELENADFFDRSNKVVWPSSFLHYLGDHHNPPSQFFYDYVNRGAAALSRMQQPVRQ